MIAEVGNSPADKNMTRIEEVHQAGEHVAGHFSTRTDDIQSRLIAFATRRVDILRTQETAIGFPHLTQGWAGPVSIGLHRPGSDRRSRRHGFQTPLVAARTQRTFLIHADMTDVTSAPITATVDSSVRDDARADTCPNFDKDKMIDARALSRPLLAQ